MRPSLPFSVIPVFVFGRGRCICGISSPSLVLGSHVAGEVVCFEAESGSESGTASNPNALSVAGGIFSTSSSVSPQLNQMICIPAFRAAGMACVRSASHALWPGPFGARPMSSDRKKFCMSIMTRAVLAGSMVMGVVVVERRRRGVMGGDVGIGGWVRSKPERGLWSQKFVADPIMACWLGEGGRISGSARARAGAAIVARVFGCAWGA